MSERKNVVVPAVVAAIAAIVVLAIVVMPTFGNDIGESDRTATDGSAADAGTARDEAWEQLVGREPDDPMAMEEVDAPVVMVNYSEFQCPFCGKFARDTAPTLIEEYVEDGTLRIEWRDFPYLGPESTTPPTRAALPPPRASSGSSTTPCTPTSSRPTAGSWTRTISPASPKAATSTWTSSALT